MTETTEIADVAPTSFEEALKSVTPISTVPFPYTELQTKWLEDLETCAPHWQGEGRLLAIEAVNDLSPNRKPRRSGFCCLGRACLVAGASVKMQPASIKVRFEYGNDIHDAFLPSALADEMQMETGGEFRVVTVDDAGDMQQAITIPGFGSYSSLTSMNDGYEPNYKSLTFRQIAAFIRHDPWRVFVKAPLPENTENQAAA